MAQAMMIRRGGGNGGTVSVNVTAVANYASLPASPSLYQMCVISSIAVANVFLTNASPASPTVGDIQIGTGYANTQPIYLDGAGKVAVYPTNAYQYSGTEWTAVDLYTWNGSSWVPPWKYMVQGGLNKTNMGGTLVATAGTIQYNTGNVWVYHTASAEFRKGIAIDVTPYKYLKLSGYLYYGNGNTGMYMRPSLTGANVATLTVNYTNQVYSVDISAAVGLMYFGLFVSGSTIQLTDWWLE